MFTEQWDPKSPWADRRVRLAANLAIDRQTINQAETLGFSRLTASMIPQSFEGYWPAPLYPYDSQLARQLLAEAGYPNGFDAGMISVDMANASFAEAVAGYWGAVGIRATLRPQERAAFFKEYGEKRFKHIIQSTSAAQGNAATRLDAFVAGAGLFTYGTYPDIEGLIREQATELDRAKREAILQDPAAHSREGHVRPAHGAGDPGRLRAKGRRVGHRAHHQHGGLDTLRGAQAQGEMRDG